MAEIVKNAFNHIRSPCSHSNAEQILADRNMSEPADDFIEPAFIRQVRYTAKSQNDGHLQQLVIAIPKFYQQWLYNAGTARVANPLGDGS
jgi:hypothetical protein